MLISALICGLNGAGSALASPMGFCATVRLENATTAMKAVHTATSMAGKLRLNMTSPLQRFHSPSCARDFTRPAFSRTHLPDDRAHEQQHDHAMAPAVPRQAPAA